MTNENNANYLSLWQDVRGVSFSQGFLDANGIKTRYLQSGDPSKPLVLALHGIGGHAEAYMRNLGAHGEDFWFVAIDLLGCGWTDKPDVAYEIRDYAQHVLDVIATLGRKSAMISGESIGGWIAAYLAVNHADVVEKLVLNTAAGWTAHPEVMARLKKISNEAASDPSWERITTRIQFLMHDKKHAIDDLIETRRAIYSQPGYAETTEKMMCVQEMEIRRRNMITEEEYKSIKAPTLVIWTSHDPTATPEEGKQIADMIPGAQYVVMNECGHWPQYEDQDKFNKLHIDFLLS